MGSPPQPVCQSTTSSPGSLECHHRKPGLPIMGNMFWLSWAAMVALAALVTGQTREDGRCGPDWGGAKCDHIPPFPTCCQANGHCGWDCDSAPAVAEAGRPAARPVPAPAPALVTTDLTGSVVPSLVGRSAIPTQNTGAALSMGSVGAPRSTAIATLASTTVLSI